MAGHIGAAQTRAAHPRVGPHRVARLKAFIAAAVAIASMPLMAAPVLAQQPTPPNAGQPGTPEQPSLGQNPNAANEIEQTTATAGNLLLVPLSKNIPGAVKLPTLKSPVGEDPAAVQRGMNYFISFNCVGCHAANGGGGMGPALSNNFFKFGSEPAQMYNVISHGAPLGMPAWGSVIPDSAIWDIIAYIQSISNAPSPSWGTTVNAAEHMPAIEQVPAEFGNTSSPWNHTQPFSNGQKPTSHKPTGGTPPLESQSK